MFVTLASSWNHAITAKEIESIRQRVNVRQACKISVCTTAQVKSYFNWIKKKIIFCFFLKTNLELLKKILKPIIIFGKDQLFFCIYLTKQINLIKYSMPGEMRHMFK